MFMFGHCHVHGWCPDRSGYGLSGRVRCIVALGAV